jgi:hypothetical protein
MRVPEDWIRDPESARRIEERTRHSTAAVHSSEPAARVLEYVEYHANERLICPRCGWSGQAGDAAIEYYEELFDVSCPRCEKMLLVVSALVDISCAGAGLQARDVTSGPQGAHEASEAGHPPAPGANGDEEPVQEDLRDAE